MKAHGGAGSVGVLAANGGQDVLMFSVDAAQVAGAVLLRAGGGVDAGTVLT